MLAFQDYANAVNKAAKVCEFLESDITDADKEIRELSEQITDEKKELDRLGQTVRRKPTLRCSIRNSMLYAPGLSLRDSMWNLKDPTPQLCAAGGPPSKHGTGKVKTEVSDFLV